MALPDPKNASESALLGGSLTWVAGFVDAVGYLTLSRIYAANMSGNSVALAVDSARTDWHQAFAHACPLLAFLPGLIVGAVLIEICKRVRIRTALTPAMLFEATLLATFVIVFHYDAPSSASLNLADGWLYILTVSLLAFAMGFQNGRCAELES